MRVALDTNIILDAAMDRPGSDGAKALIQAVLSEELTGIVTANSITDIHYIVKKRVGEDAARTAVYNALSIFETVPVGAGACMEALNLPMEDYEDAVLAMCAKEAEAEYIATRDAGLLDEAECPVPIHSPESILEMLREEADSEPSDTE